MTYTLSRFPSRALVPAFLLLGAVLGRAADQASAIKTPAREPQPGPSSESAVALDPFEVSASADKSYGALNSNSITAFKTELDQLPVSADVFDQAFLKDTGLNTVEQTLQLYSAGAGSYSSQPDTSAANSQALDRNANGSLSLRGLQAPSMMINGFFPAGGGGVTGNGITTNFNVDKIEVINGPQALLYGVSGAGGVVNITTKQARLGKPAATTLSYQIDQYGHKQAQLDYGVGTDRFAIRLAMIDQTLGGRRVEIGGPMQGAYLQLAAKPFANTTIRATMDDEAFNRINANSGSMALTALSTANDARNGQILHYLIATNQLSAAANGGASGAGSLTQLNWDNVDALAGEYSGEYRGHHQYMLTADTLWTSWLSSQVAAGYRRDTDIKVGNSGATFDAPNVAANPTGTFAMAYQSSAESELWEPSRQKVVRASLLADNAFFGGKVHSQTIVGADSTRTDGAVNSEYFVQADSNFNPVLTSATTANGYQIMPTLYWGVPNGPVQQPYFNPLSSKVTYNGVNYVRAVTNGTIPANISPSNQEGLSGTGTGDFRHTSDIESGVYAANFSTFLDGKLTTLAGFRSGKVYNRSIVEAAAPNPPSIMSETQAKFTAFNLGVNGQLKGNLRAYAEVSDNFDPPGVAAVDPYGAPMKVAHGFGEEVGLKDTVPALNMSGSIAVYHANSKNEELAFTSTIARDINPSGLNGVYNAGTNLINVNRDTEGVQLTVTAAPGNWRFRLSAADIKATIGSNVAYAQLYNDQFYANSAGNVTFKDGTPVYVAATYNAKNAVLAAPQAGAPNGYIPLTIAMMNTATSPYYANPLPVSSAITNTSSVASVLKVVDPIHGPILTGALGLPISALQIAPNASSLPPGNIVVTQSGDAVSGFPRYSMNFIGVYTFADSWLKGVKLGASGTVGWQTSMYYYYPSGVAAVNSSRIMLYEPTETLLTGIIGYQHKFKRVDFSTQLNINNLFNHYHVLLLPSYVNGWAGPDNATFDQQPRSFVWTTTLGF